MDQHEVNKIREQFIAGQWPQLLESVLISGLRGWTGETVQFRFPITAVVGENGTGKSTLLKVSAAAYEHPRKKSTYYPSTFFPVTPWDRISNVALEYRVKRGNDVRSFRISKATKKWSFPDKRVVREVFLFDVSRTLPLDASAGYAKIAKQAASEVSTEDLRQEYLEKFCHVLSRDYSRARFAVSNVDRKKPVGVVHRDFGEVSQFHQGAGEDATLDLFRALQDIPDYSLLIIDEVEASLHPRAQRRLMRFLLWLARQKRIQIILSTHSPYILEELPQEARLLLLPGTAGVNLVYGVSAEFALSRIDDATHPELTVYVEDAEAGILLREILASRASSSELLQRITICPVGPANVVQMMGRLGAEGKLPHRSLAILDGDTTPTSGCICLPGNEAPERIVFSALRQKNWVNLVDRFGVGAGTLYSILEDAMLEPDHHKWTTIIGDRVLKSSKSVWETLAHEWARECINDEEKDRVAEAIMTSLTSGT